ncbi:multiple sugar transport system substrate-binding protein [Tamaricihabitans halophyticus]|uniref:Multiple sugar transport system substrate-binding protein n=1 Tax=Tamaricihabitans halophyticus TaxID=1262583 RepID=A0A4R2QAH2_9PSEU|nr:sugar ABC transporter substrate-binding protein [Tamaricihabitans halophyticus]TCP45088.1 multiple sugar transport system substrate-binding protein [Tamaricihabitans halophyticus]
MRRTSGTIGKLAAALSAVLALLIGGCASAPSEQDLLEEVATGPTDELGLLTEKPYDGTHIRLLSCCRTTAQFAALQRKTDREFTAKTGITVEWANIPYESYLQKIVAETAIGGGTYDLVVWPDAYGASAKIGLQPLNEVMRRADRSLEEFSPPFQQAARAGDPETVYGIPFRGFSYNLFYRESEYERLGIEPAKTWDEFSAQLDKLDGAGGRDAFAGQYGRNGGQNLYTWMSMLWSNGADVLDDDGQPAFTSPEGIAATEQYLALLRDGHSPAASTNWTETDSTQSFEQGHTNSVLTWAWQMDDFSDPAKVQPKVAEDIGVASLPGWPGKPTVTYGYTWLMGILNTSDNQGAAWEYLKWLTHPDTERDVALDKSEGDTATSVVVHRKNMLDPEVNAANHDLPKLQESALRNGRTVPMTIDWPQIQDVLEVAINQMAHGADIRPKLHEAAAQIRTLTQR